MNNRTKLFSWFKGRQGSLFKYSSITATAVALFSSAQNSQAQQYYVTSVPSIEDLRKVDVTTYSNETVIAVSDYYPLVQTSNNNRGRGGGRFRFIKPSSSVGSPTDDKGRYIVPYTNSSTAGVWERILDGETPNVKMWGATGDGVTYDSDAIDRAINGIASYGCGEIFFPAGTYLLTNTMVINSAILKVTGEGPGLTTLKMSSNYFKDIFMTYNADRAIALGPSYSSLNYDHNLIIRDLYLRFQGANATNAALVLCNPGEANSIQNIRTDGGAFGIRCYGVGVPGLKLYDVSLQGAAIAGVGVEPCPGAAYSAGGPIKFTGVSGDQRDDYWAATASLIRFSNVVAMATIDAVKGEGTFGGGLIQYKWPSAADGWSRDDAMGYMAIQNVCYNGGSTKPGNIEYTRDLVVLKAGSDRTPSVSIDKVNLISVRNLITDEVSGRNVESDTGIGSGAAGMEARIPIQYEGWTNNGTWYSNSRLVKGQTAFAYFYPTTNGWYRIAQTRGNGRDQAAGRVTISSFNRESTVIDFDVTENGGNPNGAYLNVVRKSKSGGSPYITQARAYYFNDPTYHDWAAVDVYVGVVPSSGTPKENRIAIALDINDCQNFGQPGLPLVGNPFLVSPTLPSGAVSSTVNTYW